LIFPDGMLGGQEEMFEYEVTDEEERRMKGQE